MPHRYAEIAFTPTVKKAQEQFGSRNAYARMEGVPETRNHRLSEAEAQFIAARNSFYMATVSETGWPYIQHRGGPTGFVRVLDDATIGFADFRGNRQYISLGNLANDDRVSLFFMDYPNKTRLKLFGRVKIIGLDDEATLSRTRNLRLPRPRRARLPDQGRGVRLELSATHRRALHARRDARDDGAAHRADRRTRS